MLKHILEIAIKDLRIFASDRKSMIISFAVPITIASFFAFIMGGAAGGGKPESKIAVVVVNEDTDPLAAQMIEKLKASDMIAVEPSNRKDAEDAVKTGKKGVAIIFPKGFSEQARGALFAGTPPKLEEIYDPVKGTERQVVQGALMQTLMQEISKAGMSGSGAKGNLQKAYDAEQDPERKKAWKTMKDTMDTLGNAEAVTGQGGGMKQPFEIVATAATASKEADANLNAIRSHTFGGMSIQGILMIAINSAMLMLADRRRGVWTRMKAAPVSSAALVLGKGLGTWVIGFFVFSGVMLFGMATMGIRVEGSWIGLGLIGAMASLMAATFGLCIAALGKTEEQSRGLSILAVLMMVMLGGAWFPTFLMPKAVQTISMAVPVRWAVDGIDSVMTRGTDLGGILLPVAVLMGFSVFFASFAVARLRKI